MAMLHNQPLLCTSISAHHFASQHYSSISGQFVHQSLVNLLISPWSIFSSLLLNIVAHHSYSFLLVITIAHHCFSSISAHEICSSLLVILFYSLILSVKLLSILMYTSLYTSSYIITEQVIMLYFH